MDRTGPTGGRLRHEEARDLSLTPDEAVQLRDALTELLSEKPEDSLWHRHVIDGRGRVLTVWMISPDHPDFGSASASG